MRELRELALLFLKLGTIGFGGPAAHIAMMEDEVVSRRRWMTREHFLDLVGATNLIPGPNSTEMAIHVGYQRAGWAGLVTAGACFILPAVLLTGLLAWAYKVYGTVPEVMPFIYGIKPAVIAVILSALWKLGKKAVKGWRYAAIGIAVALLVFGGLNEVLAILLGGLLGGAWIRLQPNPSPPGNAKVGAGLAVIPAAQTEAAAGSATLVAGAAAGAGAVSLSQLGLTFLKIGFVLFGSGYVLIAFMEGELVGELGWLTQQQLIDAIAIGQFTPGPVLSTATFVGYLIADLPGALIATLGIFLPSFIFVAILNPLVPRMRRSRLLSSFLDAVNVSAMGLMLAVTLTLGSNVLVEWPAVLIAALASFVVFYWRRVNAAWVIIGGAAAGYLLALV